MEKGEGSLSSFILPIETREIITHESRGLGKGVTLNWACNKETLNEPELEEKC